MISLYHIHISLQYLPLTFHCQIQATCPSQPFFLFLLLSHSLVFPYNINFTLITQTIARVTIFDFTRWLVLSLSVKDFSITHLHQSARNVANEKFTHLLYTQIDTHGDTHGTYIQIYALTLLLKKSSMTSSKLENISAISVSGLGKLMPSGEGILSLDVVVHCSVSPLSLFFACTCRQLLNEPRVGANAKTDGPITNATTKVNIEEAESIFQCCGGVLAIEQWSTPEAFYEYIFFVSFSFIARQLPAQIVCSVLREKVREDFESCVFMSIGMQIITVRTYILYQFHILYIHIYFETLLFLLAVIFTERKRAKIQLYSKIIYLKRGTTQLCKWR